MQLHSVILFSSFNPCRRDKWEGARIGNEVIGSHAGEQVLAYSDCAKQEKNRGQKTQKSKLALQ